MNLLPDFETFRKLSKSGNLIAISASVPADLETPVSAYLKVSVGEPYSFLLESAEQDAKIGRYSFIGLKPKKILIGSGAEVQITETSHDRVTLLKKNLIEVLEKDLQTLKLANPQSLPEFCGGYVGYLGYENVQKFESIRLNDGKKGPKIPDAIFFLTQEMLIFDHFQKTLSIVIIQNISKTKNLRSLYHHAHTQIEEYLKKLRRSFSVPVHRSHLPLRLKPNMSKLAFTQKVRKIKEYIRAGDCIQVVLSQRFRMPAVKNDFQIYRALRSINPSPYMFYFKCREHRLIGSSPEVLVRKKGKTAEVRPIAGTRPRGKSTLEDLQLEENLRRSVKEKAEHLMLVDLGRNDLGRVCLFNSIQVQNFARVERYSHVMHLVSDVIGRLKPQKSAFDLLKAVFPAGTVSGAPKIRAMEIIDELEMEKRGPYAGCLGYFSFTGDMDMCITIRTLVCDKNTIYAQAGAGIVQDSKPEKEYEETLSKAKVLLKAIEMRHQF